MIFNNQIGRIIRVNGPLGNLNLDECHSMKLACLSYCVIRSVFHVVDIFASIFYSFKKYLYNALGPKDSPTL